jgi:hypothetical protein
MSSLAVSFPQFPVAYRPTPATPTCTVTVQAVCDVFLHDHGDREGSIAFEKLRFYLMSFARVFGEKHVTECGQPDVLTWLARNPQWRSPYTQRDAAHAGCRQPSVVQSNARHGRPACPSRTVNPFAERTVPMIVNRVFPIPITDKIDADKELMNILVTLAGADDQLTRWLEQHGSTCVCAWCQNDQGHRGTDAERDIRGFLWTVAQFADCIAARRADDEEVQPKQ